MSSQDNILHVPDVSFNIASASMVKNESETNEKQEFSSFLHPRVPFLRKIYSLLFATIFCVLFTAGTLAYILKTEIFKNFIVLFASLLIFCGISIFVFRKKRNLANQPKKFAIFLIFHAVFLIFLTSLLSFEKSKVVLMIFAEIDGVFLFFALYSFITQNLLTYQVATLFILSPIFIIFNIFLIFSEISLEILIFASIFGILCGFYLIYQTQTIMQETKTRFLFEKSDILLESIAIYSEISLLFLRNSELLLDILITRRNSPPKLAISSIN